MADAAIADHPPAGLHEADISHGPKKEEKPKIPTAFESSGAEGKGFVRKGLDTLIGGLALASSAFLPTRILGGGGLEAIAMAGSQPLGKRITSEKFTSADFRNTSIYGAWQSTVAGTGLLAAYSAGLANMGSNFLGTTLAAGYVVGPALAALATVPLVLAAYPLAYFLNNNYSFSGMAKKMSENLGKTISDSFWTYGASTAAGVATALAFPIYWPMILAGSAVGGNLLYRLKTAEKIYFRKALLPVDYAIQGLAGLINKSYDLLRNFGSALTGLFSGIGEYLAPLERAEKAAPAAAPAGAVPAPAH